MDVVRRWNRDRAGQEPRHRVTDNGVTAGSLEVQPAARSWALVPPRGPFRLIYLEGMGGCILDGHPQLETVEQTIKLNQPWPLSKKPKKSGKFGGGNSLLS